MNAAKAHLQSYMDVALWLLAMGASQVLAGDDLQRHIDTVTQRIKLRRGLQLYQQVHQRRRNQLRLGVHH